MVTSLPVRLLAISLLCWHPVRACGVLVHNELLHRSSHLFALPTTSGFSELQKRYSPLLLEAANAPSLQSGAFFPDWGYQCLRTDDDAEAAHWPPFLVASVEHIVTTYGYLTDSGRSPEETKHLEGLISFILAVASHQTADATWHGIRLPSGFLTAISHVDFGGDGAKAHRTLDIGGDFALAARLSRLEKGSSAWISDNWKVPVEDLVQIYKKLGRKVDSKIVRYCTIRGLAALRSGMLLGSELYDTVASISPMLVDDLDSYHLGGLDEMAARTVSCWGNLTRWLSNGIDEEEKLRNGWGLCDVFQAIKARGGGGDNLEFVHTKNTHNPLEWGKLLEQTEVEVKRVQVKTDSFGAEYYSLPPFSRATTNIDDDIPLHFTSLQRELLVASGAPKFKDPTYLATYTPYAQFGASLAVGNFSPSGAALAVGASWETEDSSRPGEGNVYILPLADISSFTAAPASLQKSLKRPERSTGLPQIDQRFGSSVSSWKTLETTFLAVAAPGPHTYDSSSPPSLPFAGTAPAGRIDLFRPGEPSRYLSFSLKGAELGSIGQQWWGEAIISADLDGSGDEFLIVGGPRSDGYRVCQGRAKSQRGEGEVVALQLNATSSGFAGHENTIDVPISSEAIKISGITINTYSVSLPDSEKEDVPCDKVSTYEFFGSSLVFSRPSKTLFIGSPGRAKIFAYTFSAGNFTLKYSLAAPPNTTNLRTAFGGSGLIAGVSPAGKEWLAVASHNEAVADATQAGVVRIYTLPHNDDTDPKLVAEIVAEVNEKYTKFGKTIAPDGETGIWIGSGFANQEKGAVWWADVGKIVDGSTAHRTSPSSLKSAPGQEVLKPDGVKTVKVPIVVEGSEPNAHFGATIVAEDVNGDGKMDLIVGAPYSGVAREEQQERYYGAVAVYIQE